MSSEVTVEKKNTKKKQIHEPANSSEKNTVALQLISTFLNTDAAADTTRIKYLEDLGHLFNKLNKETIENWSTTACQFCLFHGFFTSNNKTKQVFKLVVYLCLIDGIHITVKC